MSLYDELLARRYRGYLLLGEVGSPTTFFGWNLQYGNVPQSWLVVPATFDSVTGPTVNDWKKTSGYFVSQPVQPDYWTILGSGPYALTAQNVPTNGLPEDIDLFSFEAADPKAGTVKVKWVMRGTYLADAPDGWVFGEGTPAAFRVGFPTYTQGVRSGLPSSIVWA